MRQLVELGWSIAALNVDAHELTIMSPEFCKNEKSYFPPSSILIYGVNNLIALRDFLNEHYPKEVKNADPSHY